MPFNALTVGGAVTPAVVQTFVSHYLNRNPRAQKPTAHLSYDEGLNLIRKFLVYASHHTVEDIQRFTSQWVPHPKWVKVDDLVIPSEYITKSAEAIQEQLGRRGIEKVGGKTWWQWRRPGSELKAEWIEMRSDWQERKKNGDEGKRVMLYVHGGAYFFGSVDEHRYQMQRHARKLKARVFAPRYRLAPQFPFPCGLHDCLAAYLYLLTVQDPTTIVLAGDSAGGGMVLSMLVTMRDQGIPLPAGAVLISPWVDLTHSFPSVAGNNPLDYIPAHGFLQKPSKSWPPPNSDDILAIHEERVKKMTQSGPTSPTQTEADAIQGFHVDHDPVAGTKNDTAADGRASNSGNQPQTANTVPGPGHDLSIMIDGNLVEVKDQIQMYATNQLISHPLVSPVLQPSLGGLPPLLILTGGGEMLRDEQIYLAHKASNPAAYPPGDAFLDEAPLNQNRDHIHKWKPTDVQLQVWEDLCHVAPTLSFTRPAKYMYRSVAQFGAWALARAQKTEIEILDDDDVSVITDSDSEDDNHDGNNKKQKETREPSGQIGRAGDPLPAFKNHMIRQRVDRHGNIYPLEPAHELPGCNLSSADIGVIKEGPVKKWMTAKKEWDTKFASSKRKVQKQRAKDMAKGYQEFGNGEVPPPSALAGRRKTGEDLREQKKKRSMGLSMWAGWGSKHDHKALVLEQQADKAPEVSMASAADGKGARPLHDIEANSRRLGDEEREKGEKPGIMSRRSSRRRLVSDENQTGSVDEDIPDSVLRSKLNDLPNSNNSNTTSSTNAIENEYLTSDFATTEGSATTPSILIKHPTNDLEPNTENQVHEYELKRPKSGGIAFPFTVAGHKTSASMTTLTSEIGILPVKDVRTEGVLESGVDENEKDLDALRAEGGSSEGEKREREVKGAGDGEVGGYPACEFGDFDVGSLGLGKERGERPPLETFHTAFEVLRPLSSEGEEKAGEAVGDGFKL